MQKRKRRDRKHHENLATASAVGGQLRPRRSGRLLPAILATIVWGASWAGPDNEGIKVHGDWVITITNPDGTLVRQLEFQNALRSSGAELLALILSNEEDGYLNAIEIVGSLPSNFSNPACPDPNAFLLPVREGATLVMSTNISATAQCLNSASQTSWSIETVRTWGTAGSSDFPFTEKTLDTPITGILPDQIVTVKVEISFS
jgi:hypothetical protein